MNHARHQLQRHPNPRARGSPPREGEAPAEPATPREGEAPAEPPTPSGGRGSRRAETPLGRARLPPSRTFTNRTSRSAQQELRPPKGTKHSKKLGSARPPQAAHSPTGQAGRLSRSFARPKKEKPEAGDPVFGVVSVLPRTLTDHHRRAAHMR